MLDELPRWLLAMNLWTAALLGVAVVLDRLLARRVRAAWRIALYATVVLRLALPADWHSPFGALGDSRPSVAVASTMGAPSADLAVPVLTDPSTATLDAAPSVATSGPRLGDILFILWCSIATTLLGVVALRHRALARRLVSCERARPAVEATARGAVVLEHETLGPLTFGLLRPRIVVPRGLVDRLSATELGHVLAHERAHVERRDGLLAAFIAGGCALMWPILPLWIAAARVRALVERAADERALAGASAPERIAFGRTLLRLAGVTVPSVGALALGGYRDLHGRVAALRGGRLLPIAVQVGALGAAITVPLACAGHADRDVDDPMRCAELKADALAAHDRFESGAREQGAVAQSAYDAYADSCVDHPDRGEVLYYRGELYWARAHATHREGADTRGAFALAHAAFLEALDAGAGRFEADAATAQMVAKRAELGIRDPEPVAEPAEGTVHVDRGPSIHDIPPTEYDEAENALLASYDVFEAHVDDLASEDLQRVLLSRATLAMKHHRFAEARAPLERLLSVDDGTQWHVRGAEALVDLHTIAWTDPRASGDAKAHAGAQLLALCDRLPTLGLWQHESATRLHRAVPLLRAAVTRSSE